MSTSPSKRHYDIMTLYILFNQFLHQFWSLLSTWPCRISRRTDGCVDVAAVTQSHDRGHGGPAALVVIMRQRSGHRDAREDSLAHTWKS